MNITELLAAIYAHHQDNDPEGTIGFYSAATASEIDATAAVFQARFPEDLRELYLQYGMVLYIWGTIDITGVAFIPETHQQLLEISAEYGEVEHTKGPVVPIAHTPTRIPFAGNSDLNFSIDLDPPTGGTPGQIVRLDLELGELEVVADSLQAFLAQGLEYLRSAQ